MSQDERERLEIAFWREPDAEPPGAESLNTLTNKLSEGRVLLEKLDAYAPYFANARRIFELGGGQGWAACMIARRFGHAQVITSDIGAEAVASLPEWERIFKVRLRGALACRSYAVPLRDESIDLVVVFAAAHHFGRHRGTLAEVSRVLAPGGHALYLHEPACRDYIYRAAVSRVNHKRPVVREDVLRYKRIAELAKECSLGATVIPAPTTTYRGAVETAYYMVLQRAAFLQRVLPCSVDIVFDKR